MAGLVAAVEAPACDPSAQAESLDVVADVLQAVGEALALAEKTAGNERKGQPSPQPWWR